MNIKTYDAYYNDSVSSEDIKSMYKVEFGIIAIVTIIMLVQAI